MFHLNHQNISSLTLTPSVNTSESAETQSTSEYLEVGPVQWKTLFLVENIVIVLY